MVQPRACRVGDTVGAGESAADADLEAPWSAQPERRESQVSQVLHGQRLDKAVVAMAGEFSRSHLQGLIEQGHVSVDGVPQRTASRKVLAGQTTPEEVARVSQSVG